MKVLGIVGWKNTGKTGLTERLVAEFSKTAHVATMKHAHHGFDVDQPGTDSHRHRIAGARSVLVASERRVAIMSELHGQPEPSFAALLAQLGPAEFVFVEGWKSEPHPKIETWLAGTPEPPLACRDSHVVAVASDGAPDVPCPVLPIGDTQAIAAFIRRDIAW